MSSRLSYHRKNQKKNRETITGILSGRSRFAKTTSTAPTSRSRPTTSTAPTSRPRPRPTTSTAPTSRPTMPTAPTSRPTMSTAPTSRPTSLQSTSRPTSRRASPRPATSRHTSPQPTSPSVLIESYDMSSLSQTTPARKRRKTTTGVAEIGDDGKFSNFFEILQNILNIQTNVSTNVSTNLDDDAPLTRKEAKFFFNELKREISAVRKLLEISGVGDYATDEKFIDVSIICEIS